MIKVETGNGSIRQYGDVLEARYNQKGITVVHEKVVPTNAGLMWYITYKEAEK